MSGNESPSEVDDSPAEDDGSSIASFRDNSNDIVLNLSNSDSENTSSKRRIIRRKINEEPGKRLGRTGKNKPSKQKQSSRPETNTFSDNENDNDSNDNSNMNRRNFKSDRRYNNGNSHVNNNNNSLQMTPDIDDNNNNNSNANNNYVSGDDNNSNSNNKNDDDNNANIDNSNDNIDVNEDENNENDADNDPTIEVKYLSQIKIQASVQGILHLFRFFYAVFQNLFFVFLVFVDVDLFCILVFRHLSVYHLCVLYLLLVLVNVHSI